MTHDVTDFMLWPRKLEIISVSHSHAISFRLSTVEYDIVYSTVSNQASYITCKIR